MKKIVALTLVLVMVFALCACGGSKGGATPGTYKLTGMVEDGEDMSDYIPLLESMGMEINLVLNKDGTGYLEMYGEQMELTWDANSITIEGESEPYTVDGDTLTISEDDTSMTFTRQ